MKAILAKLIRADELLLNLAREVREFEASLSPPRVDKGYKSGTSTYAFFAHGDVEVPLRFAVLAGEVVHQLRSSLDHLIAHVVFSQGGAVTRVHQFPICSTQENYQHAVARGCLEGVPVRLQRRIEGCQPFNMEDPRVSELLVVQELNNLDKHRLLVVVAAAARVGQSIRVSCGEDATITGMSPPNLRPRDGSEFFSIDFARRYDQTDVDIDVQSQVALQRPTVLNWPFDFVPLVFALEQVSRAVHQVVGACLHEAEATNTV